MPSLSDLFVGFLDSLTGHLALAVYLLAVTGERAVWKRLKKLPLLFLSPLIYILFSVGLYTIPELRMFQYYISSFSILVMCTLWVQWAWKWEFWKSFAATCMAGIFQVSNATLSAIVPIPFAAAIGLHLGVSIVVSLLLYKLQFGRWFCLLLDNKSAPWQMALLLFTLEATMEMLLRLAFGVQPRFLRFYYLLVVAMVILMAVMIVYLAQRIDTARKIQAQQDVIIHQRLYEQDLEMIRREVRTFRHDYKNLLAGLSQQAGEGELEGLRRTLSDLDAGFDLRLGRKIQASTQIGNLQIPEVRSLLFSKLTAMREKGVECRLEVLYPVVAVDMDVWDFVRCLGILSAVWGFWLTTQWKLRWTQNGPGWRSYCWLRINGYSFRYPTLMQIVLNQEKCGMTAGPPRARAGGWACPAISVFWRAILTLPLVPVGKTACLCRG